MVKSVSGGVRRRTKARVRGLLLLGVLAIGGALLDPAIIPPIGPLAARPERVDADFTRCGEGEVSFACVIDGDTLRYGDRSVRIVGIDAPELAKPHCPAERAIAERAADRLAEMLNEGPFDMIGHRLHGNDRFDRDLRVLVRDGQPTIGQRLRAEGLAHRYIGMKKSWC